MQKLTAHTNLIKVRGKTVKIRQTRKCQAESDCTETIYLQHNKEGRLPALTATIHH